MRSDSNDLTNSINSVAVRNTNGSARALREGDHFRITLRRALSTALACGSEGLPRSSAAACICMLAGPSRRVANARRNRSFTAGCAIVKVTLRVVNVHVCKGGGSQKVKRDSRRRTPSRHN